MKKHKKIDKNIVTSKKFGDLMDSPMDEFKAFICKQNIGFIHSLTLLVESSFEQLVAVKDDYIKRISDGCSDAEKRRYKAMLEKVYAEMQVFEEKQTYLIEVENRLLKH